MKKNPGILLLAGFAALWAPVFAQARSASTPVTVTDSPLETNPTGNSDDRADASLGADDSTRNGDLTLSEAVQEAVDHSPVYRQARDEEGEASWGQVEAFSDGFLPHVKISGEHLFDIHYPYLNIQFNGPPTSQFPSIQPDTDLSLDASFDLFDGFRNIHHLDSANNRDKAAKILEGWSLFQLREQIRMKFYSAIAAQELSKMADENVKTLKDHLRIVDDQLRNGQATRYDQLRVKVQLDEAKSDQISANDQVVLARENLAQVMGLKADDRPLKGELPVLDAEALTRKVQTVDFYQRPDLQAADLQARAAADDSAASHASLWVPKVSLIGQYQWYDTPDYLGGMVTHTNNFRDDYYIGASASWDLFDGLSAVARANQAGAKAKAAQDAFEASEVAAPYDFDLWKRRLVSDSAIYKAKLTDVAEAKESARLATVGYEAGTRTTTDVLDAELEEYRAAAGVVQAQLDALEALIHLELSVGKRIGHE